MQVRQDGELMHRVSYEPDQPMVDAMIANGWRTGFGDEWIRLGATSEHTVDGSFSERTMSIRAGYPSRHPPITGILRRSRRTSTHWVERVWRAGIQPNCHANGDIAIDMYLTRSSARSGYSRGATCRPKFTHSTLAYPDLIARMKALDAVPALFTSYAYYNPDKFKFYGEALMEHMMPYRSYLDAGIKAAGGSRFPAGAFRAADGHPGDGDADWVERRDLGR